MTLLVVHIVACFTLAAAASYRLMRAGPAPTAHRFLFPYIIAASLVGMVISYLYAMEFFVAYYSGSDNPHLAARLQPGSPYAWFYASLVLAPLLPAFAIFPWIGKRPLAVARLGILATLPGLIFVLGDLLPT
jgi:hypothetical protein